MDKNRERRYLTTPISYREEQTEGGKKIYAKGYAATYNNKTLLYSWDKYEYYEVIREGFFDDVLDNDVVCLVNHQNDLILGRTTSGTLTIGTDETGLWYECLLDERNTNHLNLAISLERGDINKSSFAFNVGEKIETYETTEDKTIYTCELVKCSRLYDVSPVVWPAYEETESYLEQRSKIENYIKEKAAPKVECTASIEARSKLNILKSKF